MGSISNVESLVKEYLAMILVAAVCLLGQSRSNFNLAFPLPTGTNGYEDYLKAADIVNSKEFIAYSKWQSSLKPSEAQAPEGFTNSMTPLEQKRAVVQRFGKALQFIALGNTKPLSRPGSVRELEAPAFQSITALALDASYVAYSKGDWDNATSQILDVLSLASNTAPGGTTLFQVGNLNSMLATNYLWGHKLHWSIKDCEDIRSRTNQILKRQSAVVNAVSNTYQRDIAEIQCVMEGTVRPVETDAFSKEVNTKLTGLSRADKAELNVLLKQLPALNLSRLTQIVNDSEDTWSKVFELTPDATRQASLRSMDELARVICQRSFLSTASFTEYLRSRCQLRLIGLAAAIESYRWKNGRLPGLLKVAANAEDMLDPLSGKTFQYKVEKDQSYLLYSEGSKETGPVDLLKPKSSVKTR